MARDSKKGKRAARWLILFLLVALIITFRLVEEIGFDKKPSDRFVVAKVVDGDTVELLGGDKLRLLSIDTPESGEPFHDEATGYLKNVALGKVARIEFANRRRDRYGRLLGYLYIEGIFVNKTILENGLGYLYLFRDTELNRAQTKQLLVAQRAAIHSQLGIWSLRKEPEECYYARDNSFRLHRPGCRTLAGLKEGRYRTFTSREEGCLEGLSPCRICRP